MVRLRLCLALGALLAYVPAWAGEAVVIDARALPQPDGNFRFDVTVRHADTGWDHYADQWQVVGPDGKVIAARVLAHPHVDEQPFTRSLAGVAVPDGIRTVLIRAHDTVHGMSEKSFTLTLPGR